MCYLNQKRKRSISGLEVQGRLCGEGGIGVGPCKLFVSGKTFTFEKVTKCFSQYVKHTVEISNYSWLIVKRKSCLLWSYLLTLQLEKATPRIKLFYYLNSCVAKILCCIFICSWLTWISARDLFQNFHDLLEK